MQPPIHSEAKAGDEQQPGIFLLMLSFRNPQFRLLWISTAIAGLGMMMGMLAQGWLVLTLTDSAFWVGATAGFVGLGMFAFGLIGGAITDRLSRRYMLITVHLLSGGVACLLAILIIVEEIKLWHILLLAILEGALVTVAAPATLSLIYDIVGKGRMLNATAATAAGDVLTMIFGGLLTGTLITATGLQGCYLFIAGTLILAPLPLAFMNLSPQPKQPSAPLWRDGLEGLRYATRSSPLRSLLLFSVLMEFFGFSYHVMLPVIARDVLNVGASGLGYLAAAGGVGALISTVVIASLGDFRWKGLLVVAGGGGTGLFLILFALSPYFYVSLLFAALVSAMLWLYDTNMVTLIQVLASDAMRGRLTGLLTITWGFTPVGGFLAGAIASLMGAPFAIGLGGGVIVASSLGVFQRLRKIN